MGSWILIPRTAYGDGVLQRAYHNDAFAAARQLVLLGAGMDSRAYRPELNLPELRVFEVDHGENFRVKEAILQHPDVQAAFPLAVESRHVVSTDFADAGRAADSQPRWARDLCAAGYDPGVPSVWLLEGLMMYLTVPQQTRLARTIGQLSCAGSVVFHDAISASYVSKRISVAGAPFVGGLDDYLGFWRQQGGFAGEQSAARNINELRVDRWHGQLSVWPPRSEEVVRACARGEDVTMFVEAWK